MNNTAEYLANVLLGLLTIFALILVITSLLVAIVIFKARRKYRWFKSTVDQALFGNQTTVNVQGEITAEDAEYVKAYVRQQKEREARDSATLDTATEFHREI